jgi:hypothetical protein
LRPVNEADVMREDDERFQRFVPLLRRLIILVAVIAATPVVLWTITAFVRAYVGPPRVPTFHQAAATAPANVPANADTTTGSIDPPRPTADQSKLSDLASATAEAKAAPTTATDARDVSPMSSGPLSGDRAAAADGSAAKMAAIPATASANLKGTDLPTSAAPEVAAPSSQTGSAQQSAAATEQPADAMPAATPLSGPIPLPRRRPHGLAEANMTQTAQTNIPTPRPRPDNAGPAAQPETPSPGPLEFLQNIFH